jgi:hypothetical protein
MFCPLIPFTLKVANWSKFVVGPALPLSSTSTFTPPSKHPKGQILVGANNFLEVNIYPYHPNIAKDT